MLTSNRMRILLVVLLLGGLFGLIVWYGSLTQNPAVGAYPNTEALATDYQRYLGDPVTVGGEVIATSPVTIAAEYGNDENIRLTITGLTIPVTEGHHLRVYGVARSDNTIQSINAFTVPPTGLWYTWTISFVGGVWVLDRIIRDWEVDAETWTLHRRETPLGRTRQAGSSGKATPSEEVADDA